MATISAKRHNVKDLEDVVDLVSISLDTKSTLAVENLWDAIDQIVEWSGNGVGNGGRAAKLIQRTLTTIDEHIKLTNKEK